MAQCRIYGCKSEGKPKGETYDPFVGLCLRHEIEAKRSPTIDEDLNDWDQRFAEAQKEKR